MATAEPNQNLECRIAAAEENSSLGTSSMISGGNSQSGGPAESQAGEKNRRNAEYNLHEYFKNKVREYNEKFGRRFGHHGPLDLSDEQRNWYLSTEQKNLFSTNLQLSIDNLKYFLGEFVCKHLRDSQDFCHLDLGCHDGIKSREIFLFMRDKLKLRVNELGLVDNGFALEDAVKNCRNLPVIRKEWDFRTLGRLLFGNNFVSLFGNTISNCGRGKGLKALLRCLNSQMDLKQYLTIEFTDKGLEYYTSANAQKFARGYLGILDPNIKNKSMRFFGRRKGKEYQIGLTLQERYSVDDKYFLPEQTEIITSRIQIFSQRELQRRFRKAGFKTMEQYSKEITIEGNKIQKYHYALFKKVGEFKEDFQLAPVIMSALLGGLISGTAIYSLPDVGRSLTRPNMLYNPEIARIGVLKEGLQARIDREYLKFKVCQEEKFPLSLLSPKGETAHGCRWAVSVEYPLRKVELTGALPDIIKSAKRAAKGGRIDQFTHDILGKFSEEIREETWKGVPVEINGQSYLISFQSREEKSKFIKLMSEEY